MCLPACLCSYLLSWVGESQVHEIGSTVGPHRNLWAQQKRIRALGAHPCEGSDWEEALQITVCLYGHLGAGA